MKNFATAIVATSMMISGTALANENWANKSGDVGVGANMTLSGVQGLEVRYGINPAMGVGLTVGMNNSTASTDGGDNVGTSQAIGLGVAGTYKVIKAKTASGSVVLSADYRSQANGWINEDEDEGGLEHSDVVLGLGFQGEVFLAKKFSLHSKVGLTYDAFDSVNAGAYEGYGEDKTDDDNDYSGASITLGGGILAGAGFTVWF
jgi:hypothetical protein